MEIVILSIHLLVCICLIGLVLLQRSEGGALGMGGGGGALMSGRGAADALAKMTQVAGGFFLVTSLSLTVLSGAGAANRGSVFDRVAPSTSAPAITTPATPPATTTDRPDPTESSAEPNTQLASLTPAPAEAAAATPPRTQTAPPATSAAARAAPLATAPATTQRTSAPAQTTARPPATTTQTAATTPARQPAATTPPRSGATTTPASSQTRPLVLPNTSGSVSGIALDDASTQPESVEVGNGVEAVRRQTRAGPDQ